AGEVQLDRPGSAHGGSVGRARHAAHRPASRRGAARLPMPRAHACALTGTSAMDMNLPVGTWLRPAGAGRSGRAHTAGHRPPCAPNAGRMWGDRGTPHPPEVGNTRGGVGTAGGDAAVR